MITIRPGSHVHTLIMMLSFVGEFPVCSLHLLGSFRSYRELIRKLTQEQEFRIPGFEDRFACRLLTVSGKQKYKTVRFHKSGFPVLEALNPDASQNGIFCLSFLDGDLWRLFRFREAILSREGNFCVCCFHEQVDFLRRYLGDRIRLATVSIESVERVFKIEEKCLL